MPSASVRPRGYVRDRRRPRRLTLRPLSPDHAACSSGVQRPCAVLMLDKSGVFLVRQRMTLINGAGAARRVRHHGAPKFGRGAGCSDGAAGEHQVLPNLARAAPGKLAEEPEHLGEEIGRLKPRIFDWHRQDEPSRRLATIPGINRSPATHGGYLARPKSFPVGPPIRSQAGAMPRGGLSTELLSIWIRREKSGLTDEIVQRGAGPWPKKSVYDARPMRSKSEIRL